MIKLNPSGSHKHLLHGIMMCWLVMFPIHEPVMGCHPAQKAKEIQGSHQNEIFFSCSFTSGPVPDSVSIYFWEKIISVSSRVTTSSKQIHVPVKDGKFAVRIPTAGKDGYLSLSDYKSLGTPNEYLSLYYAQSGDSIHVDIGYHSSNNESDYYQNPQDSAICYRCNIYSFSGRRSIKYQVRANIDSAIRDMTTEAETMSSSKVTGNVVEDFWNYQESRLRQYRYMQRLGLSILEKYNTRLDGPTYQRLQSDLISELTEFYFRSFAFNVPIILKNPDFKNEVKRIQEFMKNYPSLPTGADESKIVESPAYGEYLIRRASLQNLLSPEESLPYVRLKREFSGQLRERLLTGYVLDYDWKLAEEEKKLVHQDALNNVHEPLYLKEIYRVIDEQNMGAAVYNFALEDANGKLVHLSDFKGKVVFIDFWFDGCSNCASYYQSIVSKAEQRYEHNPDVIFLTIATMSNHQKWKAAIKSGKYTSDKSINLISPQGNDYPLNKQFNINSAPHPIVVDRTGHLFNNSASDLRMNGETGLSAVILSALTNKPI